MRPRHSLLTILLFIVIAVAVALNTAGCGSQSSSTTASSAILRLGTSETIPTLNPFPALGVQGWAIRQQLYPSLVQYDDELNLVPEFAAEWSTNDDQTVWTFKTQPAAKWSDGQPMTAADAAWTINTLKKYKAGATASLAGTVTGVTSATAPDATTLIVTYRKPIANALSSLQMMPILPQHVWGEFAKGDGNALVTYPNKNPVSGGAWVLTEYKKDSFAMFKRNKYWYGDKPRIAGFGLKIYANTDAMVQALVSNQLDAIQKIPPTVVDTLQKSSMKVATGRGQWMDLLIINSNPKKPKHRELLDNRVREAMSLCIDRTEIVKTVYLGYAEEGSTIVAPVLEQWHNDAIAPPALNTDQANAILDGLGFAKGSDGVRVAKGSRMSYEVILPSEQGGEGMRSFQIVKEGFAKAGIEIRVARMDSDAAFNAIMAPDGKYLSYDLCMWAWMAYPDPDFILSVLTTQSWGSLSDSAYTNPVYDAQYLAQRRAVDATQRKAIVDDMQGIIATDKPYIPLDYRGVELAHSAKWTGFHLGPQGFLSQLNKTDLLRVSVVD